LPKSETFINVFIGWGGVEGAPIALGLDRFLESERGYRCFVARRIGPGLPELPEIIEEIRNCDVAIMIVTRWTFRSRRWRDELNYMYRKKVPVLPFVAQNAPIPALLDFMDLQWFRFNPKRPAASFWQIPGFVDALARARRRV
jgi:hypothetical protein